MIQNCLPTSFISVPVLRSYSEETDDLIDEIVNLGGYILGGYARWSMSPHPEPPSFTDLDIFVDKDNASKVDSFLTSTLSVYSRWNNRNPYVNNSFRVTCFSRPVELTDVEEHGRIIKYPRTYPLPERVQIITSKDSIVVPFYSKIDEFDFTVCQAALCNSRVGYFTYQGYKDEKSKVINLNHCRNINSIPNRLHSYLNKGYEIPSDTFNQILSVIPPKNIYQFLRSLETMLSEDYPKPISWMKKLKFLIHSVKPEFGEQMEMF